MSFQRLIILSAAVLSFSGLKAQINLPSEEADKHHTNLLVSRIRQQVGKIVPRKIKGMPPEEQCIIHFPGPLENPDFNIRASAYPIRIFLPHHFGKWVFRKEYLLPFVHAHLTARTGIREPLKDIWVSAALIQEIFEPGAVYGTSGYGNTPYARAMLAHGAAPSPAVILNSSMDDFYGKTSSSARAEWCSILMKQALKKNIPFEQELMRNNKLTPAQKLENHLFAKEKTQKKKKVFSPKQTLTGDWLFSAASAMVLGRGIPAAVPWIEENFQEIFLAIHPDLKIPEKESKKGLSNDAVKNLMQAEIKLNHLAMKSPEQIALKLFRCAKAIRQFRENPYDKKNLQNIRNEEHTLYETLSERADLEYTLRLAEQRLIPPGTRFALTLNSIDPEQTEIPLLKKANQLMDHFEKDF